MKLKELSSNSKNYEIHIKDKYVPMYDFCKYKYLLNLPGNQPWSYRKAKILPMGSLIIDILVNQSYIINNKKVTNGKWIQFFTEYFTPNEDYIEISYDWIEGITNDKEVNKIYKKINKIYDYYENNQNEYDTIRENAVRKANQFNTKIFNKTYDYLIRYFNKKMYKENSVEQINDFLDKMILLDKL
jgi:hypothetical protein